MGTIGAALEVRVGVDGEAPMMCFLITRLNL